MNPNRACTAACLLSVGGVGAFTVYAVTASRADGEMNLSTVLDAAAILTVLIATTVVLKLFAALVVPLRKDLASLRWELQRTRKELIEAQPTEKAIAGYALGAITGLVLDEDDEDEKVVNLHR